MSWVLGKIGWGGLSLHLYSIAGFANNATYGYDPNADAWATKTALPNVPASRHEFAIGAIGGKVYVTGGTTSTSGTYVYDPTADTWTALTAATTVVESPGYAVLSGKLYVVGGATAGTGTNITTVQVYDPGTDSWSTVASLPAVQTRAVCGVIGGKIYAASGFVNPSATISGITRVYDPATNAWTAKATKPTAVGNACGAAVAGKLYVVGGATNLSGGTTLTANVEAYDPTTDTWASVATHPLGASDYHAACEYNGKLFVSGGTTSNSSSGSTNRMFVYDPALGTNGANLLAESESAFESGLSTNWSLSFPFTPSDSTMTRLTAGGAHTGTAYVELKTVAGDAVQDLTAALGRTISVTAGTAYKVSFWLRPGSGVRARFQASFCDAGGSALATMVADGSSATSGAWNFVTSAATTAPPTATTLQFIQLRQFGTSGGSAAGDLFDVDDLYIGTATSAWTELTHSPAGTGTLGGQYGHGMVSV